MILIDTCVISEVRHPKGNPTVADAFAALSSDQVFFSVITIGEIAAGLNQLQGARKRDLSQWLDGLQAQFADRILGIDPVIARVWGELTAMRRQAGHQLPVADGLMAATARHHNLSIMTRNVSDFAGCGVPLVNPWEVQ